MGDCDPEDCERRRGGEAFDLYELVCTLQLDTLEHGQVRITGRVTAHQARQRSPVFLQTLTP